MPWSCCHPKSEIKREDRYKVADDRDFQSPTGDNLNDNMFSWERRPQVNIDNLRINDVSNTTVVRRGVAGQPMAIENCQNSNVLVLDYTATVTVDDCADCLIVLGPCSGSVFLRECQRCTVLVACQQLRTRDCHAICIASHCITQPIIEETTDIIFHPLTLHYDNFIDDMIAANLKIFTSCSSSVHDFTAEKGILHYQLSNELLPLSHEEVSALNKCGVSADLQNSDLPFYESGIPPSHYYYAGYSKNMPLRQFVENCLEVLRAVSLSSSLRLVSTIELDVNKHVTIIDGITEELSTLLVIEVCGSVEDIEELMDSGEICFRKIPEEQQEYFCSDISRINSLRMT